MLALSATSGGFTATASRTVTALLTLRDQVIRPSRHAHDVDLEATSAWCAHERAPRGNEGEVFREGRRIRLGVPNPHVSLCHYENAPCE